jgi:Tfp pilus assembly protein PilF
LEPDLPEGHLALGFSFYYGDNDFDAALKEFETAQRGLPNANEVYLALGAIQRRKGRWAESNANFEKSAALNPKESWALQNLAINYEMARDYDKANATLDRALKVDPRSFSLWGIKAKIAIEGNGDFSVGNKALEMIEKMPPGSEERNFLCAESSALFLLQRKYSDALRTAESVPDDSLTQKIEALPNKYLVIGAAQQGLNNEAGARAAFTKAKDLAQERVNAAPLDPDAHMALASALAFLGEKEAALAETQTQLHERLMEMTTTESPPLEPAARRVDDLMNMFAGDTRESAQGPVWIAEIRDSIAQVTNPKVAGALHDARAMGRFDQSDDPPSQRAGRRRLAAQATARGRGAHVMPLQHDWDVLAGREVGTLERDAVAMTTIGPRP